MSTFVDTSALYAVLDGDDSNHDAARRTWAALLRSGEPLVISNYVVVETDALVRRRLGLLAARRLHDDVMPVLEIEWIGSRVHTAALSAALAGSRRGPSLVDCASFEIIRERGIGQVFAFDEHFTERGYRQPGAPES